jgi:hypothetical protein
MELRRVFSSDTASSSEKTNSMQMIFSECSLEELLECSMGLADSNEFIGMGDIIIRIMNRDNRITQH